MFALWSIVTTTFPLSNAKNVTWGSDLSWMKRNCNFWNIWKLRSLNVRIQKKNVFNEVLWLQLFHKYGITEKRFFRIFLFNFWNTLIVPCLSPLDDFVKSLLIYDFHTMRVLWLHLFIEAIIWSYNFISFWIMGSTRDQQKSILIDVVWKNTFQKRISKNGTLELNPVERGLVYSNGSAKCFWLIFY